MSTARPYTDFLGMTNNASFKSPRQSETENLRYFLQFLLDNKTDEFLTHYLKTQLEQKKIPQEYLISLYHKNINLYNSLDIVKFVLPHIHEPQKLEIPTCYIEESLFVWNVVLDDINVKKISINKLEECLSILNKTYTRIKDIIKKELLRREQISEITNNIQDANSNTVSDIHTILKKEKAKGN